MSRRLTITVPDDVAARIEHEENASAFFADAARARIRAENLGAMLRRHGFSSSPEIRELMRAKLAENRRTWTPEYFNDLRTKLIEDAHNLKEGSGADVATSAPDEASTA